MLGMQDSEDWGTVAFHTCPPPQYCPPLPAQTTMEATCPGDVQRSGGPGLTVGILCLLLHLSIFRVLTAEKRQLAGISSGTQGHLLSK